MSRNGSGTYSLPAGNPVVTGTTISSTTHNNTMSDVETALTDSLTKNGEAVISGAQDYNGNELILDADGDTSITSDTDDQIDFKVGGSDVAVLTAARLTAPAFEPTGDTAASDAAAIGYTAAEGLILTGQGSTGDVTIKNDADTRVGYVPTGTQNLILDGSLTTGSNIVSDTDSTDDLGTTSARWANVYTDAIGDTGQSLEVKSSDLKISDGVLLIKEQADADADQAGFGQIWVNTATPNELYFTDDAGTDFLLNGASSITIGTEVATTSGASVTISSSVPSGTKRVTLAFEGVSTTGTSIWLIRLGYSGGTVSTGYAGGTVDDTGGFGTFHSTAYVLVESAVAANPMHGQATLVLKDAANNTWSISSIMASASGNTDVDVGAGSVSLPGELTQIILTQSGSDTFDLGSVTPIFE